MGNTIPHGDRLHECDHRCSEWPGRKPEGIPATLNVPVLAPLEGMFDLKFHQVAIYCDDMDDIITQWESMGYKEWHHDTAVLVGVDTGVPVEKRARMAFNYDIMPLELEYVSYGGPRNLNDNRDGTFPFLSHLSTIVDDVEETSARLAVEHGMVPYHRFVTEQHTNPNVVGKKRFKEAIYNMTPLFGFDIKLIQRVPWDYGSEANTQG